MYTLGRSCGLASNKLKVWGREKPDTILRRFALPSTPGDKTAGCRRKIKVKGIQRVAETRACVPPLCWLPGSTCAYLTHSKQSAALFLSSSCLVSLLRLLLLSHFKAFIHLNALTRFAKAFPSAGIHSDEISRAPVFPPAGDGNHALNKTTMPARFSRVAWRSQWPSEFR